MGTAEQDFSFRSIALPAILPTLAFSLGEGAIIPIIPVVANSLGASLAVAGLIASMIMLGELFGDIPSGWIVSRIGERTAMIYAALLSIVGLVTALLAPNPWVLGVGILAIGLSTAVFALARHAFMTSFVPRAYRARALSTLGGTFRFGYFVGPFISAAVIHLTGSTQSVFWVHIVGCATAAILLLVLRDPTEQLAVSRAPAVMREGEKLVADEAHGLFRSIWNSRAVLARLGTGAALIGAMRASRQVILPLWAVSIGIPDAQTALIIGAAGAVDFALFYASGQIMDRWGRLWSALPSMIGLGIGHLILAFTHDVPGAVAWFIAAAIFMSLANGVGSGILMTLGADLADPRDPAPFLGAWRFTGDAGSAAAPLAVSAVVAAASIAVASGVMGVVGLIGAGILLRYVPRFAPHRR
ncbi:MFS transporter [Lacisediminihabitans profunda]|uniref:MFS transporter n=1 Tax=Lacisediminihabitans profunda TaxID=2594790 RepID=A0A5C8UUI9_9MICO|nr:MFS transporter [Lacisediminihabitans profunda]TXN31306.1 MFS transporter [Lacisediminihabitans profunda]